MSLSVYDYVFESEGIILLCLSLSNSVSVYLGYDIETLRSRSWYSLIHPRDLSYASAQHCALCEYITLFIYFKFDTIYQKAGLVNVVY